MSGSVLEDIWEQQHIIARIQARCTQAPTKDNSAQVDCSCLGQGWPQSPLGVRIAPIPCSRMCRL